MSGKAAAIAHGSVYGVAGTVEGDLKVNPFMQNSDTTEAGD